MQMLIVSVLVIVSAFVILRFLFPAMSKAGAGNGNTPRLSKTDRRAAGSPASPFHAVSIHPAAGGCQAAMAIKGQRFLSEQAPTLPLEDCSAENCHCRYAHHVDRRSGTSDRRLGFGAQHQTAAASVQEERRITIGRRESDMEAA